MATRSAARLASEQLTTAEAEGTAPQTSLGRHAFVPLNTVNNLGRQAVIDIGSRLGGRMAKWSDATEGQRQGLKARRRATQTRADQARQMRVERNAGSSADDGDKQS